VNPKKILTELLAAGVCSLALFAAPSASQQTKVVEPGSPRPAQMAGARDLYCAGYVQTSPIQTRDKLVGAVEEQEQFLYAQHDVVWINVGTNKGAKVGDLFTVVRPRGRVETRWTTKGELGFYVQEVGALEVIRVKPEVSAARVRTSCSSLMLGDLVQPAQQRTAPPKDVRGNLDLFASPNGKQTGRLFMARDNQEMVGAHEIVYIDLGAEDNVRIGDHLTIFRPLGKGHLFVSDEDESLSARDEGFQSAKFRGGKFSNQAPRKSGSLARGRIVTTERAKKGRPEGMRKIVGEMVILNVKERTATALITRVAQEVHTGDWVELQ
jgi:hypothetical protein